MRRQGSGVGGSRAAPSGASARHPERGAARRAPLAALAALLGAWACGPRTAPPPEPGTVSGVAPDLRGRRVMVLPVQHALGVPGDPDAELAHALRERGAEVSWILPAEVSRILARSPSVQARTSGLPVGDFLVAEVTRVGDPLYGELRRMAALVDAEVILLPVQVGLAAEAGAQARVRFWTTLLEVRTGRVLWFSVLEGAPAPAGDPRALATAADAVASALLWYAPRR